jgi:succinylarginine dihydrolase
MPPAFELNLDGLPGPTHNFAGLACGNLASMSNRFQESNPQAAALEGLEKMRLLMELGLPQGVLPPQERPHLDLLRRAGFGGKETTMLQQVRQFAPELLAASYSAAAMWVANAATVSPSADTADGRVHLTPANLSSHLHRSIESAATARVLRRIFADDEHFTIHSPLPAAPLLCDEGAANHLRFFPENGEEGVEVFVYGKSSAAPQTELLTFPARQSLEASRAVARLHRLHPDHSVFAQQNPEAIARGAFHNDLVSVSNGRVLVCYDSAFKEQGSVLNSIEVAFTRSTGESLCLIVVSAAQISMESVMESYIFNSQLVTVPDGSMCLVAPVECREVESTCAWIQQLLADENPVERVEYVDLRESMRNGGGPACLRLRVALNETEQTRMHSGILLTPELLAALQAWVRHHYRDRLHIDDLTDAAFVDETRSALDALTRILDLGALYPFQQT